MKSHVGKLLFILTFISLFFTSLSMAQGIPTPEEVSYHHLKKHPKHEEISLPNAFQHLPDHIHIHQFRANQQEGTTCGNHAIFNAVAVQELLEKKETLSAKHVRRKAKDFFPNMREKDYQLDFEDMCEFAEFLQLKNTHIVAYNKELNQFYSGAAFKAPQDYNRFMQEIRKANNILAQFILNYSEHWVTISVIKHHRHIRVLYHNSTNARLAEASLPYRFIEELCSRLI